MEDYSKSISLSGSVTWVAAENRAKTLGFDKISHYIQHLIENDIKNKNKMRNREFVIFLLIIFIFFELTMQIVGIL